MLEALGAIGPLFGVLAVGVCAGLAPRLRAAEPALTAFVLYFALPAFLFGAVAGAPVKDGVPWAFAAIAFGVTALVAALTAGVAWLAGGRARAYAAPLALAAGYGNVGYLGVPITLSILGPDSGLAAAMGQLVHNVMFMAGYPLTALAARGPGRPSLGRLAWLAAKKALLANPITLSIAAGAAVALAGAPLPKVAAATVGLFGQTAVPLAMFAVGLTLPSAVRGIREGAVPVLPLVCGAAVKTVVLPLATAAAILLVSPALGGPWAPALILMAAMPTSATAFVLSRQKDRDPRIVSGMIASSSAVSVVTIPAAAALFVT
ncbi:MAG: AEC family transporter [Bifidobacteriaceae bacterium]|jgi:predicted permease|nr:AEC family transporter [Bifidobacteriaceae bacterium]